MGHLLRSEGLFPEPEKVNSILHMKPPSNTSEVRSFLGLATYCNKFAPNFAVITEPLRRLTYQKAQFIRTGERKAPLVKLRLSFPKLQSCRVFIRRVKPKLLLTPASKVWVLFCFEKTLQIAFFNQQLLPVVHYPTKRPDVLKLKEKCQLWYSGVNHLKTTCMDCDLRQ